MSLRDSDALAIETDIAANSLPDPTTVANRTHDLTNTGSATCVWSSTGATPFTENAVNVTTISVPRGAVKRVQSDGVHWVVITPVSSIATCPAPMTRAALLALRTAGTLRTECPYIITDFASGTLVAPNLIYMHATSTTELSENVSVDTAPALGATSAFRGQYDIDANVVRFLEDDKDNRVHGATQVTTFPWANANWTNNLVHPGTTFTSTGNAAATVTGCEFRPNSTVVLSGLNATSSLTRLWIDGTLDLTGNVAVLTLSDTRLEDGFILLIGVTTAGVVTPTTVTIDGSRFYDHAPSVTRDIFIGGANTTYSFNECDVGACLSAQEVMFLNSAGGIVTMNNLVIRSGNPQAIRRDTGNTGNFTALNLTIIDSQINVPGATSPQAFSFTDSTLIGSTVNNTSNGGITTLSKTTMLNSTVTHIALATRGTTFVGCSLVGATVSQNRNNSANNDNFIGLDMVGGTLTLAGSVASAIDNAFTGLTMRGGSVMTATNLPNANAALNSSLLENVTVNLNGTIDRCRFGLGGTINTGVFTHTQVLIELAGTTTLTANNTNTQRTKAFSDVV